MIKKVTIQMITKNKTMFRAILLLIMIGWDISLHYSVLIGKDYLYPLMPSFISSPISHDFFWTFFWSMAFLIMITIIQDINEYQVTGERNRK